MSSRHLVATWVRRFLLEHVVADLNLSRNTQASYRDVMALLLPFAAKQQGRLIDQLEIERLAPDVVRRFLAHLEDERHCSVATRNQRLAAIHAFARFIGARSPEHLAWSSARGTRRVSVRYGRRRRAYSRRSSPRAAATSPSS